MKEDEDNYSFIWEVLDNESCVRIDHFAMALKAGMEHFPEDLGFLFEIYDDGKTACRLAIEKLGKEEVISVIRECIPDEVIIYMVSLYLLLL